MFFELHENEVLFFKINLKKKKEKRVFFCEKVKWKRKERRRRGNKDELLNKLINRRHKFATSRDVGHYLLRAFNKAQVFYYYYYYYLFVIYLLFICSLFICYLLFIVIIVIIYCYLESILYLNS